MSLKKVDVLNCLLGRLKQALGMALAHHGVGAINHGQS
jgi:hypothetical protein